MHLLILTGIFNYVSTILLWFTMMNLHLGFIYPMVYSGLIAPALALFVIISSNKEKKEIPFYLGLLINIPFFIAFLIYGKMIPLIF